MSMHGRSGSSARCLNFYPYYKSLVESGQKKTTIRLGIRQGLTKNSLVMLSSGWSEEEAEPIGLARIVDIYQKKIEDLTKEDLEGESPDCSQVDSIEYVLSAIYRKVVTRKDVITIVKWNQIVSGEDV